MTKNLMIRSANPTDADELLVIRRDAIMALAEEYGRVAAERWATAARPDRAAKAIATDRSPARIRLAAAAGRVVVGGPGGAVRGQGLVRGPGHLSPRPEHHRHPARQGVLSVTPTRATGLIFDGS